MRIYAIRHGETVWNTERRAQGMTDVPLNEKGIRLAEVTAEALKDVHFDRCYTSPLVRAGKTAEIIMGDRDITVINEPRLAEISFGTAEGKRFFLEEADPEGAVIRELLTDPWNYPGIGGGETVQDVLKRTGEFREELLRDPANRDKTIFISTHGCALRAFFNVFYEDPSDFWQHRIPDNCAVTVADIRDGSAEFIERDRLYYDPALCTKYFEWK